jgi:PLP dependent protein
MYIRTQKQLQRRYDTRSSEGIGSQPNTNAFRRIFGCPIAYIGCMSIASNILEVQKRIAAACNAAGRDPHEVKLIAVSKTHPASFVDEAFAAGQLHFGENRVQEMVAKAADANPDVHWHMIGTMQTNKIRLMASFVEWIHSVPSIAALDEISKRALQNDRVIKVLIQVNISDEDQKSGCEPEELEAILKHASTLPGLEIHGLMGMASFVDDPETVRPQFAHLRSLRDSHRHLESPNVFMRELSMGMSHDMDAAILEGSTMVRVGTAIFGSR